MRLARLVLFTAALLAVAPSALADEHDGDYAENTAEHGGGHDDVEINLFHGFVGESDEVEPSLLYRPVGAPPPLAANVINTGLLFLLIYVFGRKPIADALKKRKERIVSGMTEAGKMRDDAARQLAEYEAKLKKINDEIDRVRQEMREAAESERKRILAEAEARRVRMEQDARLLIEQEIKAARETLVRETVRSAVASAEEILKNQLAPDDHDRLANDYLDVVKKSVNTFGGRA
jgi:F-type H+-transporting ATPase subunit b